ncbi:hypothetical protein KDW74_gp33 [Mycobacterium phage Antsirabe]|uniref:Uncharacterized protein n=1 Tax=Mycobacterium phage Antsirabe TaxID=2575610 RepID=A0A5J6TJ53_9CAUD|nr:hypothetical protein KDW74_gp33 [Mycobacterium phage Antsirabe]QFG09987.1 hypothetical protein PBI_ANTSIRABE_33 [Mycobacterium phage Antsirabe]
MSAIRAWRELAGDALIAAGVVVRGRPEFSAQPQLIGGPARIQPETIRSALDELPDSRLLRIAATIIAGWKPILFQSDEGRRAAGDVDVLVATLRDRANQFEAVERDADRPFHHLTPAPRGE